MRISRLLVKTLREAPSDAEVESHKLLLRAGYIQRLASGVQTYLPLGLKVLANISSIIRQELDAVGAQEMLMPVLQPLELWEESGRDKSFGEILPAFVVTGRGGKFVLGPTHEEVVTRTVSAIAESWRNLPVTVYQLQTKFRDEARPRFGLLRTRELLMCDAYSFDADKDSMAATYEVIRLAYNSIFSRLSLEVVPVEASSGAIGGDVNHEYMVPSSIGEDLFVSCTSCDYKANVEAAKGGKVDESDIEANLAEGLKNSQGVDNLEFYTPGSGSIAEIADQLSSHLGKLGSKGLIQALVGKDENGKDVVMLVPGSRSVVLPFGWKLYEEEDFDVSKRFIKGFIGPVGLEGVTIVADPLVSASPSVGWVVGGNKADTHIGGVFPRRDFNVDIWMSLAQVEDGDLCPICNSQVALRRSVEAAHTFQLGLTYSSKMEGATFLDKSGTSSQYWMGCYGIGVSRLMAVVAEANCDNKGLIWPKAIAPFLIHVIAIGGTKDEKVFQSAEKVVGELEDAGIEVLFDDREVSAGVAFNDADLIGIPWQLVIGAKGLAKGVFELKNRRNGEKEEHSLEDLAILIRDLLV